MTRSWTTSIALFLSTIVLIGSGCRTVKLDNVQTLTEHPQFPTAAQAAPEFTRAALRTVADLEYQIERRGK